MWQYLMIFGAFFAAIKFSLAQENTIINCDGEEIEIQQVLAYCSSTNDFFRIDLGVYKKAYLVVYDRWGEVVYETTTPEKLWDGSLNGKQLSSTILVYYLEWSCDDKNMQKYQGDITILN